MPSRYYGSALWCCLLFSMATYKEKLLDPRWQKKRLEILNRDEFVCVSCCNDKETLHVHHLRYLSKDPWDTPNDLLITLCASCHSTWEEDMSSAIESLREVFSARVILPHQIKEIAAALMAAELNFQFPPNIDVIAFALKQERFERLSKEYFDSIKSTVPFFDNEELPF